MSDVTKGFHDGRFLSLSERDQRDVLKLMARVPSRLTAAVHSRGPGLRNGPPFAPTWVSGAISLRLISPRGLTDRG